tara:strand:- start:2311 stop:2547 length:237 start_codon:yes stop_codon:yes gene_type:complete
MRVERTTKTGGKVLAAVKSAGSETNRRHANMRSQRQEMMSKLVPIYGVDNAAAHCETQGLGNWEAIKRQWNRQKKRDT